MRHNGRPALPVSRITPTEISALPGQPILIVCPDCQTWRRLTRHMIVAHRATDHGREAGDRRYHGEAPRDRRCKGSGQRIVIDTPLTGKTWTTHWAAEHRLASTEVRASRPTQPTPKPHSAAPTLAPTQMPEATRAVRQELAAHRHDCERCRSGLWCETASSLARRAKRTLQNLELASQMVLGPDGKRRLLTTP
ncbi:hypothetical protein [Streptacidiphilus anmyonensis]|uniref:hypothetical protein n=1 Tax=Streptacidiphilus anmyonensis TaxID=405782 RepID=UPI0006950954|nr:hypothetical protein [Streptacidiphilus anmyonensis]